MRAPLAVAAVLLALAASAWAEPAPAPAPADNEFAARHILLAYKGAQGSQATRTKEEAKALAAKALAEAKAPGADFAKVSHAYSDDKFSDQQGGFLGFFERGLMTPAFQEAVERLKEGEFADVVETPFGFHVVQRLSLAQGKDLMQQTVAVLVVAQFAWKGARGAQTPRAKDLAFEDATKAQKLLAGGANFKDLPPELDAKPLFKPPTWQPAVVKHGMMRPEFKVIEEQGFALSVGGVSAVVESPAGWLVLRRVPYFRIHAQHLVVTHSGTPGGGTQRTKEQAKARAEEALAKLKADPASWAKVVAEYSDEPGAAQRAGALTVEPGKVVPEFEEPLLALPPGATSGVVESPFGYHVIRRLD